MHRFLIENGHGLFRGGMACFIASFTMGYLIRIYMIPDLVSLLGPDVVESPIASLNFARELQWWIEVTFGTGMFVGLLTAAVSKLYPVVAQDKS